MRTFFVFLVLIWSCSASRHSKGHGSSLGGNWELSVFSSTDKTFDEIFSQRHPQLQFDVSGGTVTGNTGCNRLSGTFTVINDRLSFSNFTTTRMACPGYEENTFLDALGRINRYTVDAAQLSLLHDSILVMSFARRP